MCPARIVGSQNVSIPTRAACWQNHTSSDTDSIPSRSKSNANQGRGMCARACVVTSFTPEQDAEEWMQQVLAELSITLPNPTDS
jgi:hypothetical protein